MFPRRGTRSLGLSCNRSDGRDYPSRPTRARRRQLRLLFLLDRNHLHHARRNHQEWATLRRPWRKNRLGLYDLDVRQPAERVRTSSGLENSNTPSTPIPISIHFQTEPQIHRGPLDVVQKKASLIPIPTEARDVLDRNPRPWSPDRSSYVSERDDVRTASPAVLVSVGEQPVEYPKRLSLLLGKRGHS